MSCGTVHGDGLAQRCLQMMIEQYAATIASLAVTTATSIKYQTNFDDILATVRSLSTKPSMLISLCYGSLRI